MRALLSCASFYYMRTCVQLLESLTALLDLSAGSLPLVNMFHHLGGDISRCRILSESIHELSVRVHQIKEDATNRRKSEGQPLCMYRAIHNRISRSPVINEVVIGRFGIGWCGEVHSVRFASLLDSLERSSESDHPRVELCDAVIYATISLTIQCAIWPALANIPETYRLT